MKIKLFSDNVPYAIVGFFMTKSKVSWLSWGKESFRKAQKQDKPVYNPLKLVETVDPKQDKARLKSYGYPVDCAPNAYVCFGGTCNSFDDLEEIAEEIGGNKGGK